MGKALWLLWALALARVYVYAPEYLRKEVGTWNYFAEIPSSLANFGNPPYGSSVIGRLFQPIYGERSGCFPISPFNYNDLDQVVSSILLVEGGDCAFAQKVKYAQDIGFSAVLISDPREEEPADDIIMTYNETAGYIAIPSFLIGATYGKWLRTALRNEEDAGGVLLTLTFYINQKSGNVNYQIWTSADLDMMSGFLTEFAPYARKLEQYTEMTPHYVLWHCFECSRAGYTYQHPDCVSSGRYCAPDPDGPGPLTGRQVVLEDLRQICIYRSEPEKWWDYIQSMNKTCPTSKLHSNCYERALEESNIDEEMIATCMSDSFISSGNIASDNELLRYEQQTLIEAKLPFFPAIVVNDQEMRGNIETFVVLQAICAGFIAAPSICADLLEDRKPSEPTVETGGMNIATAIAIACVAVLLLVAVLVLYRVWLSRKRGSELKQQRSQGVEPYFELADTSRNEG